MADQDESLIVQGLAGVTMEAGAVTFDDWTYAVTSFVWTSHNVSSCEAVAYSEQSAARVEMRKNFKNIQIPIMNRGEELFLAQGSGWVGVKCSVARSGRFRLEYSYDIEEAIRWVGDAFVGGSSPEQIVELFKPVDL